MATISPQILYFDICKSFYDRKVRKKNMTFSSFYDDVGFPTITEAVQKDYPPDGRFYNLLNFRFIDYKRKPNLTTMLTDYTVSSTLSISNTPLEKAIFLIEGLIELVINEEFKEQQVGDRLKTIVKEFEIDFFLGIPINEILCIQKSGNTTRANQSYHRKKFEKTISKISSKSFSTVPVNKLIDYKNVEELSVQLFELGLESKGNAQKLENNKIQNDYTSLFLCFLYYLKASIYFKEALSLDVEFVIAKYNYAYTLKRLGKLDIALDHLEELKNRGFDMAEKESRVLESIGDIYLIKEDYKKAEQFFLKALKLTPADPEIAFNLLKVYTETKNNIKVEEMLSLLLKIKKHKLINRQLILYWSDLLSYLINNYNGKIAQKSLTINK